MLCLPSEGRERLPAAALPRYHPPWPPARGPRRRAPSLGSRCRFYSPPVAPALSSGGSGVIFTSRSPPGSHRPRVAHGCVRRYSSPSTPFAAPSVRGARAVSEPVFQGRAGHNGCRTGVPRCRGLGVDLSSQHDSRARSQYVKGPRPWWRRKTAARSSAAANTSTQKAATAEEDLSGQEDRIREEGHAGQEDRRKKSEKTRPAKRRRRPRRRARRRRRPAGRRRRRRRRRRPRRRKPQVRKRRRRRPRPRRPRRPRARAAQAHGEARRREPGRW